MSDLKTETRVLMGVPELRDLKDHKPKIIGYAAKFNERSLPIMGLFEEQIAPGAFTRALKEKQDVRALIDHAEGRVLGRTAAGTLTLAEDETGLRVEIDPPDTSYARDILESIRRGDVTGMSFAFRTVKDSWDKGGKTTLRTLLDVDISDVSVVTYPAYPSTEVSVRKYHALASRGILDVMRRRLDILEKSFE